MRFLLLAAACAALPPLAQAESPTWSRFRGPNGSGNLSEATIPDSWTKADYTWQTELPGEGTGSMVAWGDRVFLLSANRASAERQLVCIDLHSGRQQWQQTFASQPHHLHGRNTYAASTPCCDAQHVYAAWSAPQQTTVVCFTHDGQPVWEQDLGPWQSQHGFGTSPMLAGDNVILFNSQQGDQVPAGKKPGESQMVALDRSTGEIAWATPLTTTRVCYGTPCLRETDDRTELIGANTGDGLFAIDAATGERLWNLKVFRTRCVSSPIVADGLVLGSAGSGGGGNHLVAVRPPVDGGEPTEAFRIERRAPYVPTPVYDRGRLFVTSDDGIASCFDAETGKQLWMRRLGGTFSASPLVLGDKLLCINMEGTAYILRAAERFESLGTVDVGGPVQATPAYVDGRLLIRAGNRLLCLAPGEA